MSPRLKRAFTLVELLVVVTIIGILLALLMPTLMHIWGIADDARCVSNLHRLWQAISMRQGDELQQPGMKPLRPAIWPSQLLPYMEQGAAFMTCPVADAIYTGGSDVGGMGGYTDPGEPGSGDAGQKDPWAGAPRSYASLTDLAEVKVVTGGGATYYTSLEEGRWVVKLSEEQFNDARARGLLSNADSANYLRSQFDCTYRPGSNPNVYWLCVEDHGSDEDYKDVMIKVTEQSDGSFALDVISGTTGHRNTIVSKPDGQELLHVPSNTTTPLHITLKPTDEALGSGDTGGSGGTGATGGTLPDLYATPLVVVATNYAMNINYSKISRKAGKILLMDYVHYLAYTTDDWTEVKYDPDGDGIPRFARHWGRVNVLFGDGSVRSEDPRDLNPAVPAIESALWAP